MPIYTVFHERPTRDTSNKNTSLLIAEPNLHRHRNRHNTLPKTYKTYQKSITKTIKNQPKIHQNRGPEALPEALPIQAPFLMPLWPILGAKTGAFWEPFSWKNRLKTRMFFPLGSKAYFFRYVCDFYLFLMTFGMPNRHQKPICGISEKPSKPWYCHQNQGFERPQNQKKWLRKPLKNTLAFRICFFHDFITFFMIFGSHSGVQTAPKTIKKSIRKSMQKKTLNINLSWHGTGSAEWFSTKNKCKHLFVTFESGRKCMHLDKRLVSV